MQRRLSAIFAADVVGYSKLMAEDEAGTLAALRLHRRDVFDPEIANHGGRIVKLMGDGTLVEFSSVVDAVEAALAIQQTLADENGSIKLRIGINLGDVIIDGEDIYGDGVNVAARLEALAKPGGIAISSIVHESLGNRIEANFSDSGEHKVKNIDRPVRVYQWAQNIHEGGEIVEALSLPEKPSIAVLPFDNMSKDPEQEYFVDGITEDIITALSRIGWMFVIARNSSFVHKGKAVDITQFAKELGVRYVLEGSVRRAGNRIRITTQLIDATTANHLWANRYDRELDDIFELQDEITETIVGSIDSELRDAEQERARRKPTGNLKAWDLYQRGNWHCGRITRENNKAAFDLYEKSVALDPKFAPPHAGLALVCVSNVLSGYSGNPDEELQEAMRYAVKAIELDDREALTHYALGRVQGFMGNVDYAVSSLENALKLNPSFAMAHYGLGFVLKAGGRAAEALPHLAMAIRLSPRDPVLWTFYVNHASSYLQLKDYEASERWARKAIGEKEREYWPHVFLAMALALQGRDSEAHAAAQQGLRLNPGFSIKSLPKMLKGYQEEYVADVMDGLRKAGLPE